MKSPERSPSLRISRRTRWILIATTAVLVPAMLLLQSSWAQTSRPRREASNGSKTSRTQKKRSAIPASAGLNAAPAARKPFRASQMGPEPVSAAAVGFAESRPLSEVAKQPLRPSDAADRDEDEDNEAAENPITRQISPQAQAEADEAAARGVTRDMAIQANLPTNNIPTPILTFEGLGRTENIAAGFGNLSPPDTVGDVGPNHYVQQTNLLVRVWDKSGTPLTNPFKLSSLFAPLGGQCAQPDQGDPIVLYDPLADRWMLSQFAFASKTAAPYHECIAVSKTGDPTGAYYLYDFVTAGNEFPDYPHLGVWPDGYYMTVHQFTLGGNFNGEGVYSFNRSKMLAGDPTANYIYFNLNFANYPEVIGGMLPSDLDGLTPPPAGRPNTFVYFTTTDVGDPANGLRLFDFHADFATPANSTFTERTESSYNAPLSVADFSIVHPTGNLGRQAIPQPSPAAGASTALDPIMDRLMHRMQYRNRGGFETLVMTHTVGAPASTTFGTFRAAPRYYELRSTAGGPFAVEEQATHAPGGPPSGDNISRWMGSAAEDNQGNLAIGYSVSSGAAGGNVFPGIRYAGRLATDPPGGLGQGEATLIDGTGVQTSTGNRWGEYSALTVDPSDDCTFWYTTEYYTAAGQAASAVGWQTRIGSFKFTQCTAPAKGTAHFTVTSCATAAPIANAVVTIDGTTYGVTLTDGTFDAQLAPGPHTYSITKAGSSIATGNFNIADGATSNVSACLAGGSVHLVVTNCATSAPISGATVSIDGTEVGTTAGDGAFDAALPPGSHTYSLSKFGFATVTDSFNITDGQTTNLPVCMQGIPVMFANGASLQTEEAPNGAIDPGEEVTVNFTLRNDGAGATSNLVATMQPTGGVQIPGPPQPYPAIAGGGGTGTQPISFKVSPGLVCGNTLTVTLHLQDGALDLGDVTYNFTVCPIVIVTATAGTTGPTTYTSLKPAVDAINAGTHQGAVTVSINISTTEGATPVTLNGSGIGSASYTSVLIRPIRDGLTVSGNPANGFGVIQLNSASNVTIDGDNPNTAGTNRNLTIRNTAANTATFTSAVRIALATTGVTSANNDTIKNLNLLGSATGRNVGGAAGASSSDNTTYGILANAGGSGTTTAPSAITSVATLIGSPATATNLLIQNNSVNTAGRAIAVQGSATTVFPGLLIKDNTIGNPVAGAADQVYSTGITAQGTADGVVSGNTLYVEGIVTSNTSGANQAIAAGSISTNTTLKIEKNRVARMRNNVTDTWPAIGINLGGGNNHVVQNNFVYDVMNTQTSGGGGGGTSFGAYGIRAALGTGHKIYHNTVHLTGTINGTANTNLTAAFMIVNIGQTGMDVRNNIFSNRLTGGSASGTDTRHTVIYLPSGATSSMNLTLNNNAYLQGLSASGALSLLAKVGTTAGTGEYFAADFVPGATSPAANLRNYTSTLSAAGTNDDASAATTFPAPFVSSTDLHLTALTPSPIESGGAASVGLTTDIDGQTRPGPPGSVNGGGTAPDLGADEFDGVTGPFQKLNQTITFDPLPDRTYGDPGFIISATASSGLPVSFAASGNCTVTDDLVNTGNAGPCTITASQAGDVDYNPAPDVGRTFQVLKATPVITWDDPADIIYGTALSGTQLNATANVPGAFVYTPAAGTVLPSGTQNLHADFTPTDTANYNNAQKDVSINVLTAVLNISMTADRNPAPVGLNFNYKPVISNTGSAPAANVVLMDVLPTQVTFTAASSSQGACTYASATRKVTCNLGTIGTGSTVNVQITVKPREEGALNNTATITAAQWDPATGNSSASVNGLPAVKQADLSVSKTDSADPIFVSQDTVYTMVVKNNTALQGTTGVVLTDTLPSGMTFVSATTTQGSLIMPPVGSTGIVTANIGVLAPNATATVTVTARGAQSGLQTNVAQVNGNESDPNSANNTANQTTLVKDAVLQKVLLAKQVLTGGCENTTGNAYLTGPAPAGGVVVALSSNITGASVPVNVFIPAGQTVSPAFAVTTSTVTAKQVGLIIAGSGPGAVSRGLTINVGSGVCPP